MQESNEAKNKLKSKREPFEALSKSMVGVKHCVKLVEPARRVANRTWYAKHTSSPGTRLLNTDYNSDTTADAVQKAEHTVILNFLNLLTYQIVRARFLFQMKRNRHSSIL